MGILDFVKGGVKEMAIARPDGAKDLWVYKHPDQTIPWKAQLTVDQDEVALFFKNGQFVGSLSAGRHTLDGNNIPFLGQLVDKFPEIAPPGHTRSAIQAEIDEKDRWVVTFD